MAKMHPSEWECSTQTQNRAPTLRIRARHRHQRRRRGEVGRSGTESRPTQRRRRKERRGPRVSEIRASGSSSIIISSSSSTIRKASEARLQCTTARFDSCTKKKYASMTQSSTHWPKLRYPNLRHALSRQSMALHATGLQVTLLSEAREGTWSGKLFLHPAFLFFLIFFNLFSCFLFSHLDHGSEARSPKRLFPCLLCPESTSHHHSIQLPCGGASAGLTESPNNGSPRGQWKVSRKGKEEKDQKGRLRMNPLPATM